jgi:hypothetical protein
MTFLSNTQRKQKKIERASRKEALATKETLHKRKKKHSTSGKRSTQQAEKKH